MTLSFEMTIYLLHRRVLLKKIENAFGHCHDG